MSVEKLSLWKGGMQACTHRIAYTGSQCIRVWNGGVERRMGCPCDVDFHPCLRDGSTAPSILVHPTLRVFGKSSPTFGNAKSDMDGIPSAFKRRPLIRRMHQGDAPCIGLVSILLSHPCATCVVRSCNVHPWTWRTRCMDEARVLLILVVLSHPTHPSIVHARWASARGWLHHLVGEETVGEPVCKRTCGPNTCVAFVETKALDGCEDVHVERCRRRRTRPSSSRRASTKQCV